VRCWLALAGVLALAHGVAQAAPKTRAFYFAGDERTGQWCAFASKPLAQARALTLQDAATRQQGGSISDVMGGKVVVDRSGGLVALTVEYGPDSGDWAVTDGYRLEGARPTSLRRVIGYADGGPYHIETYERVGDRLVLKTRSRDTRYVEMPVVADVSREPYSALVLEAARIPTLPTNGVCRQSPR